MNSFQAWLGRGKKEKKKRKGLRRVSPKRKELNKLYYQARKEYLLEHPICEKCLEDKAPRPKPADQIHHKARRGRFLCDKRFFMAVCGDCHRDIELHPAKAKEKGWLVRPPQENQVIQP